MNTPASFELAKLLKEKGFDKQCLNFYTNPRCKMFGIDEHSRYYPIKNKAKTLWISGNAATLDFKHVYYAPTIAEVVYWIYSKYDIWISLIPDSSSEHKLLDRKFSVSIFRFNMSLNVQAEILRKDKNILYFNLPENAFEYTIEYILNTYKPTS